MHGGESVMAPRTQRVAQWVVRVLIVLGLAGNIAFAVAYSRPATAPFLVPQQARSAQVIMATRASTHAVLAATNGNALLLYENGHRTHQTQLAAVIGGVAAAPDGHTIYVGTSDGTVAMLDDALARRRSLQVTGRVVGLAVTPQGGLLVADGQGAYSNRYYVSYYPRPQRESQAAFTKQVGFTITALTVLQDTAIYSLLNAQVGALAIASMGKPVWQVLLNHPVTRLLAVPQTGRILAGDQQGGVSLLDLHGTLKRALTLSQYPIHALAYDPATGDYFAGDANGSLFALSGTGKLLLNRAVIGSSIETLLPTPTGHLLLVPGDGRWLDVNPAALGGLREEAGVRTAWLGFDGTVLLAILVALVVAVRRLRRLAVAVWRARLAYAFALPAVVLIALFTYYPAAMAISYSVTNFSLRNVTQFVGLANYQHILTSDFYFRTGLANMVILTVASILKAVTVPLLVAELVFWLRHHVHQYLFRTLFVLPAVVPGLVFTLLWRQVYDPRTGLLNEVLGAVGLSPWQHAWLGDASTALWAIVAVGFPYVDAFAFLILLGGLLNINAEFFDAAKVDGAGWWARFRHVDVPLLLAQFRILLFFAITGTVQGFASIFILTQGGPGYATYVPALQMYFHISDGDFGYASAIGVILFVMIFVATLFVLRFRRQEAVEAA
jgi:ABC-type sugar transport system permease subunit